MIVCVAALHRGFTAFAIRSIDQDEMMDFHVSWEIIGTQLLHLIQKTNEYICDSYSLINNHNILC